MIEKFGVGVDIVDIRRFKKISYASNKKFYEKIFTPLEITYCLRHKNPAPHFAGKFAIKEALKKSISKNISFLNIETSYSKSKPIVKIIGKWNKKYQSIISLSHEKNFAIGVVISEVINSE